MLKEIEEAMDLFRAIGRTSDLIKVIGELILLSYYIVSTINSPIQ